MVEDNILLFIPKHENEYRKNITDFVELVTKAPEPNEEMDYQSFYWPKIGNFTKLGVGSKNRETENRLHESIVPFAKAYIKYQQIKSGASMYAHLYAIRSIEAACIKTYQTVNIEKLLPKDFDNAAREAKNKLGEGAAYQAAIKLNTLRVFLIEHKMIRPFDWKSPFSKPRDKKEQTGEAGQAYREHKMPDEDAIMGMAEIFSKDVLQLSQRDIFTTSTFSLLMSAPERGSEPLYLKADCLDIRSKKGELKPHVHSSKTLPQADGSELLLSNKTKIEVEDEEQIGIRWFSGKGFGHENKWIPSVMNLVVKTAVSRLQELSDGARAFAKLLEESDCFPRHSLCPNVDENVLLTKEQAIAALGLDTSHLDKKQSQTSGNQLLRRKGIERKDYVVTLNDLNKIVRDNLPSGWPYIPFKKGKGKVKIKWSESLYAAFANQYDKARATIYTELWIPDITTLNEDLKPTKKKNRTTGELSTGTQSVFVRHDIKGVELRSHQPRHLLDTIASVNGMSDTLRSKWAGRADPKHNRYYDHTTEEEYNHDWLEEQSSQNIVKSDELRALFKVQIARGDSRTLQEYNTLTSLAIHVTEFGECKHSYIDQPCLKHRDCINCNEHICEKGNKEKLARLEAKLKRERILLKGDKKAVDENVNGALQWYERRLITVTRCEELIKWLKDPSVKSGDRIKLSDVEDISHLDRALDANGKKRLPKIENFKRLLAAQEEVAAVELISVEEMLSEKSSQKTGEQENDPNDELKFNDFILDDL
ncbi:MAG TPA: integrase [Pseudoalteromonas sp.]|nr:integrase [Pseudoalteromonas sp.]|tara:strand:- start:14208 stop:16493 length:2286 start_codon:yes stop_codon:yes gene_type:complete